MKPSAASSVRPFGCIAVIALAVAAVSAGAVLAQSQEAQPVQQPGGGNFPQVSTPGPAPNPVRDQEIAPGSEDTGGGIDPELGPIPEPDAGDAGPASVMGPGGDWNSADDEVRRRAREALEQAAAEAAAGGAGAQSGVMPVLVGAQIPVVPLSLLFPPEIMAEGPREVRESRGTVATFIGVDRNAGTRQRFNVAVGREATFGTLRLAVSACYKSHPDDPFEAWAYLKVMDQGRPRTIQLAVLPQRERARQAERSGVRELRKGWIIASSPSVTPVDHPVYDVVLATCEGDGGGPQPIAQNSSGGPAGPSSASAAANAPIVETQAEREERR